MKSMLSGARAWVLWAVLLNGALAERPPEPTYVIGDQNIGIGGGPFRRPEEAKGHIESVYQSWPWTVTTLCGRGFCTGEMHCPASAAALHESDFHEGPSPNFWSAATAPAPIATTTPRCTAANEFNQCLAYACMSRSDPYVYRMNGVCPSPTLVFRERPNRCECGSGQQTWHQPSGTCLPVIDIDLRKAAPKSCPVGNPIYPLTGLRSLTVPLGVEIGGIGLSLTYSSATELPTATATYTSAPLSLPAFGPLWSGTLHRHLVTPPGLDVVRGLMAVRGDGREQAFVPDSSNGLKSADPSNANSLIGSSGYVDRAAMTLETHWAGGPLQPPFSIHLARGGRLSYGYAQSPGGPELGGTWGPYLVRVSDHFGRSVRFEYLVDPSSGAARVDRIVRPDGLAITLTYTGGLLTGVRWPDDSTQSFLYEHPSKPRLLTGRIDEAGHRIGDYRYDSDGVATAASGAGGVNAYTVSRASSPQVAVSEVHDPVRQVIYRTHTFVSPAWATVTDPLGSRVTMTPAAATGDAVGARDQPAGAGCDAASSSTDYDPRGNLIRSDDFVGARRCHAYDALNRESIRVEGLPGGPTGASCTATLAPGAALPAGSRKKSTEWHPLWNLPEKAAEPGVLTTHVYNGRPDPFNVGATAACAPSTPLPAGGGAMAVLCLEVRQATSDTDGSQGLSPVLQADVPARTRRWTYNESGQVLTATDPLGHTTRYTYHAASTAEVTKGDLATVTNPAGHVTRHTRYSATGQSLESIDPNGVASQYTYDLRHRPTSVTVAGQTTTYAYWSTGRVRSITEADGNFTVFEYDEAQRLVASQDSRGNRIEYTLDNAGNRVKETVRDPAGRLGRQLVRVIDALGRVQQTTGRE